MNLFELEQRFILLILDFLLLKANRSYLYLYLFQSFALSVWHFLHTLCAYNYDCFFLFYFIYRYLHILFGNYRRKLKSYMSITFKDSYMFIDIERRWYARFIFNNSLIKFNFVDFSNESMDGNDDSINILAGLLRYFMMTASKMHEKKF